MIDFERLWQCLSEIGLGTWRASLEPLLHDRFTPAGHGDLPRWRDALAALRETPEGDPARIREQLLALAPWRKGPFEVAGVAIDAEWRSDLKWARLEGAIAPLAGRRVLDVGCGNGYYMLRMLDAGAEAVIGVDPMLLYCLQFLAVCHYRAPQPAFALPLTLDELPAGARAFDTVFSMGVLYHRRSPLDHLLALRGALKPGGQLVLETLFLPGDEALARTPEERYARMRNVWLLPTVPELLTWLTRSGFRDLQIVDRSRTTPQEQRRTEWMPFESLEDALGPADTGRTIEGWPAPRRVLVLAMAP
jgi:tRNA (mo5U34)-methyltransferase